MGDRSKIEWTDASWNPIRGTKGTWHCVKISEGCRHCYAERNNVWRGGPKYKHGLDTYRLDGQILAHPLGWRKPRMVFVCSMCDLFEEGVPKPIIADVFSVIEGARGRGHIFQVLTKRSWRMLRWVSEHKRWVDYAAGAGAFERRFGHVWFGVTVENQDVVEEARILHLDETPAAVRFLSIEPMLGPIDLHLDDCWALEDQYVVGERLDWVIVGGESGPGARPMDLDWVRSIIGQCQEHGIPLFVKQLGTAWAKENGAKHAKGGDPAEWPRDLRIRQWPDARREV